MPTSSDILLVDGAIDFSGGVDSLKVTTVQSQQNPNGLARNQLAWLDNATVRDGGILQRTGWQYLATLFDASKVWQGGIMFQPDGGYPYLFMSVSGHMYRLVINPLGVPDDLSLNAFNGPAGTVGNNPVNDHTAHAYFVQGEQFVFVQAGDYGTANTLPLVWNDNKQTLSRSKGITNPAVAPGTHGVNELPAATAMDYYMGRIWYGQGRVVNAGDIVYGPSGSAANNFRDAILEVTENPLALGGDGFALPNNCGNVRCIFHNANLNSQLGQGQLFVGTRRAVHALQVPLTRQNWLTTGNDYSSSSSNTNYPLITPVQINNGPSSDRGIVKVNGDVFYSSLDPAIRSLFSAIRYFDQWGNIVLSSNIDRLLSFNDRGLMHDDSGVYFDNRLLFTALPVQKPQGIVHQALAVLDFAPLSSFGQGLTPVWEGMYEGLDILQTFVGDFGGLERCFAVVVSRKDSSIQLWELTDYLRSDFQPSSQGTDGEARVSWIVETPAYTWGDEFMLKKLASLELWLDKLYGEAIIKVEWRPDSSPCWLTWHEFKVCQPRNSCEAENVCYPIQQYREGFKSTLTLPRPPVNCTASTGRPASIAYQHQFRFTVKGWCRIRGFRIYAEKVEKPTYANIVCG